MADSDDKVNKSWKTCLCFPCKYNGMDEEDAATGRMEEKCDGDSQGEDNMVAYGCTSADVEPLHTRETSEPRFLTTNQTVLDIEATDHPEHGSDMEKGQTLEVTSELAVKHEGNESAIEHENIGDIESETEMSSDLVGGAEIALGCIGLSTKVTGETDNHEHTECPKCEEKMVFIEENGKSLQQANIHIQKRIADMDTIKEQDNATISSLRKQLETKSSDEENRYADHSGKRTHRTQEESHLEPDNQTKYINKLERDIQNLTQRLAAEMNQKISSDESNLENINIGNRPLNIATEFELIASSEWLNAKTELDEITNESEDLKIQFLCDIMLIAEDKLHQIYHSLLEHLMCCMMKPLEHGLVSDSNPAKDHKPGVSTHHASKGQEEELLDTKKEERVTIRQMPKEVETVIGDMMRKNADKVHVHSGSSMVADTLWMKYTNLTNKTMEELPHVQVYIDICSRLAWKMAIQRPPMTFTTQGIGKAWNEKTQTVSYFSDDPKHPASLVQFYHNPGLLHGDKLLVKGKVVTKITTSPRDT